MSGVGHIFVKYFWSPVFIFVFLLIKMILPLYSHMSDFVLILSLLYCWIFGGFALVLGRKSINLVSREVKPF